MAFFVDLYQLMFDETVELPNLDSTDGGQVGGVSLWSGEAQCPRVELFKVVGGGHDWPGAWGNMDISASLVGVGFLRPNLQHRGFQLGVQGHLDSAIGTGSSGTLGHFGTDLVHPMRRGNFSFNVFQAKSRRWRGRSDQIGVEGVRLGSRWSTCKVDLISRFKSSVWISFQFSSRK